MRRICLALLMVLVVIVGSFQLSRAAVVHLSEGFDDVDTLPSTGWVQVNNSDYP